jgi:hypothetical protein
MNAPTQWAPPAVPVDGWNNNEIAMRARTPFWWSLGLLIGSWLAAAGLSSAQVQSLGVFVSWLGFIATMILAVGAIIMGGTGIGRAAQLNGYRRGTALTGFLGGICVLLLAPIVALIGSLMLLG